MNVRFGEGRDFRGVLMPQSPLYNATVFSTGSDLSSLEISWNSGRSPGPTWGLATLVVSV